MSNLWINLRIWKYHFQVCPDNKYFIRVSRNDYYDKHPMMSFIEWC